MWIPSIVFITAAVLMLTGLTLMFDAALQTFALSRAAASASRRRR